MYLQNIEGLNPQEKIQVCCEECKNVRIIAVASAKQKFRKNNNHLCKSCSAKKSIKPQNTKEYWTKEKKEELGIKIKESVKYQEAIAIRDTSGPKNSMYGKKLSTESRQKMSKSRIGKTGENATAWKGGKCSIVKLVKGICHSRYNWYYKVYLRDNFCCTECGNKNKLDAHHKDPISKIIKELCQDKKFDSIHEQIEWIVTNPRIKDENLENGITLCRDCHKKEHQNWGSHNIK